ncbi:Hypothetical protein SCLAV_1531 [Streptomyces clavuligerus]|uniref:Uncharacterized protein n=1 Tax=Streptomyces clavuligerus TaxID=1901 RepID=E2Q1Y0_STRCL|nr:Hypothetical protein SCLAV_1531 [Streptomyces clavuligerus]
MPDRWARTHRSGPTDQGPGWTLPIEGLRATRRAGPAGCLPLARGVARWRRESPQWGHSPRRAGSSRWMPAADDNAGWSYHPGRRAHGECRGRARRQTEGRRHRPGAPGRPVVEAVGRRGSPGVRRGVRRRACCRGRNGRCGGCGGTAG